MVYKIRRRMMINNTIKDLQATALSISSIAFC